MQIGSNRSVSTTRPSSKASIPRPNTKAPKLEPRATFKLPPPVQLVDKLPRLAPSRLHLHIKLQEHFSSHHLLDVYPRRGADLLQHLPALAEQNRLLPV